MSGVHWTVSPKQLASIYLSWLGVVLALALFGFFSLAKDPTPGFFVTFFVVFPPIIFLVWYWKSASFKDFVHSLDGRALTLVQCMRMSGPLYYLGIVLKIYPSIFGIPMIVMDTTWGVTALLAVYWWGRRPFPKAAFVCWHIGGALELVVLAALRLMTLPTPLGILLEDVTSEGFGKLPWSLLPTFIAPNFIIFHLVCAIQGLRRDPGTNPE